MAVITPVNSATYNGYSIDESNALLVNAQGDSKKLRNKTFLVLMVLARSESRLVSKDDIIRQVWPKTVVTDDSLVQCIREIRKALGVSTKEVLVTRSRLGYELHPDPTPIQQKKDSHTERIQSRTMASVGDEIRKSCAPSLRRTTDSEQKQPGSPVTQGDHGEASHVTATVSPGTGNNVSIPGSDSSPSDEKDHGATRVASTRVASTRVASTSTSDTDSRTSVAPAHHAYRSVLSIGRDAELNRILVWLGQKSRTAKSGLCLVHGDAGMGKTRLLNEALACDSVSGHWLVCSALCFEVGSEFAYSALANWLRQSQVVENVKRLSLDQLRLISQILPELSDNSEHSPVVQNGLERYNTLLL